MAPLKEKFVDLFTKTFDASKSTEFLLRLEVCGFLLLTVSLRIIGMVTLITVGGCC